MIYTSRELIQRAKELAQVTNSKAFSFPLLVSLLNNAYTTLYNSLTGTSNSFVDYFEFTGKEADLPIDCNKVLAVKYDNSNYYLNQSNYNHLISGEYVIENRTIKIVDKKDSRKIIVKYSKLPIVLTAPDEWVEIEDTENIPTDNGQYDVEVNSEGEYTFTSIGKEYENEYMYIPFMNGYFGWKKDLSAFYYGDWDGDWDGEIDTLFSDDCNITEAFKYKTGSNVEIPITGMQVSDPYIAISYGDYSCRIFTGFDTSSEYNYLITKGKKTRGQIIAFTSDDETGKGLVFQTIDGKYYYSSFVPDTILDYPDNVFFDIIIDKLAIQLQSLQGLSNDALQTKLQNDEQSFYDSLQRSQSGMRIRNDSNQYRGYGLW